MRRKILTLVAVLGIATVGVGPYPDRDGLVQTAAAAPLEEEQQLTDEVDVAALPDQVGQQEGIQQQVITVRRSYAVKYLCGSTPRGTVPARYLTKINIHNPHPQAVVFVKKGLPLRPGQQPLPPRFSVGHQLRPDFGLELDCNDILKLVGFQPPTSSEGFVVIESQADLDVWAVYSATTGAGLSLDVERVPATTVQFTRTVPTQLQPIQPDEEEAE